MPRDDWDTYFLNIARQVATRATCDRKHVGAVLVRDKTILSTGYNGSVRGLPHCDEVGHMMSGAEEAILVVREWSARDHPALEENLRARLDHCEATVHAEANAIVQAARNGVRIDGATIYTTASPCWPCFKLIANAGIVRIVFAEFYRDKRIAEQAVRLGIELVDATSQGAAP